MRLMKKVLLMLFVLSILGYAGFSYYLASLIVTPKVLTLAEERQWIEEHNLVGDFEAYNKEEFTVTGFEGYKFHAQLIKSDNSTSSKYVIITHGFRSNRNGAIKYMDSYHKLGYHVITYDVRGHGEKQPTPVSLGRLE